MEESELLKERLQAITDKRRVQEDIAKKRRLIEEEKLQLQYIKKKALRDQWLMDGLSPQTEEDQEAQRLLAQEEQEQSVQLQSNIHRVSISGTAGETLGEDDPGWAGGILSPGWRDSISQLGLEELEEGVPEWLDLPYCHHDPNGEAFLEEELSIWYVHPMADKSVCGPFEEASNSIWSTLAVRCLKKVPGSASRRALYWHCFSAADNLISLDQK
ncbi:Palmdelphin [Merluccius polli]|uniref:Palmdelphin n=1 Tax=Merluccius polli TaxID=89951 RepID=A0AA47N7G3_MERPO|nr:Palmdelphin [Merluccius polli]